MRLTKIRHCPGCHSANTPAESFLGLLGTLYWFRCRYCGINFTARRRKKPKLLF